MDRLSAPDQEAQIGVYRLIWGDGLAVLPEPPAESVNVIATSPP
jgi:hypothetical protein